MKEIRIVIDQEQVKITNEDYSIAVALSENFSAENACVYGVMRLFQADKEGDDVLKN